MNLSVFNWILQCPPRRVSRDACVLVLDTIEVIKLAVVRYSFGANGVYCISSSSFGSGEKIRCMIGCFAEESSLKTLHRL